jgi:hypothetical protein
MATSYIKARLKQGLSSAEYDFVCARLTDADLIKIEPSLISDFIKTQDLAKLSVLDRDNFISLIVQGNRGNYFDPDSLNLARNSAHKKVNHAVDTLAKELKLTDAAKSTNHNKLKQCLNIIVSNLAYARFFSGPYSYLHYSKRSNSYKSVKRYNPLRVGYRPFTATVKAMLELGFIEDHKGGFNNNTGSGNEARMRAIPEFGVRLEDEFGLTKDMVLSVKPKDLIRLKDEDKTSIDYKDNAKTKAMRKKLKSYNSLLENTDISLSDRAYKNIDGLVQSSIDFTSKSSSRTFNNNSFEQGGRYFGPWWQSVSKVARGFIEIDGNETVSLDYTSMNVHLAYSTEGVNYDDLYTDDDPYFLDDHANTERSIIKWTLLTALNSKSKGGCIQSSKLRMQEKGLDDSDMDYHKLLDSLYSKHGSIKDLFYKMNAVHLQYVESCISEYVISKHVEQGIAVLNIHDEFIVGEKYETITRDIMKEAFTTLGFVSIPMIKRG